MQVRSISTFQLLFVTPNVFLLLYLLLTSLIILLLTFYLYQLNPLPLLLILPLSFSFLPNIFAFHHQLLSSSFSEEFFSLNYLVDPIHYDFIQFYVLQLRLLRVYYSRSPLQGICQISFNLLLPTS
jgi:hypothetical protein